MPIHLKRHSKSYYIKKSENGPIASKKWTYIPESRNTIKYVRSLNVRELGCHLILHQVQDSLLIMLIFVVVVICRET